VTRIVGGRARGRRLAVPDTGTRPTSDRAREAIFSSLESLRGTFDGAAVLDLYAGSGALGLEALSRGAARVDLVESEAHAAGVIEANRKVVDGGHDEGSLTGGGARVHAVTVERWLARSQAAPRSGSGPGSGFGSGYDVVFCDPPYAVGSDEVSPVLEALRARHLLAAGAVLVIERARRDPDWRWPEGFVAFRDRVYGEAHLWIGGLVGDCPSSDTVAPC
jgi:16S rRNA (guanine966-N2)-methyltransferase